MTILEQLLNPIPSDLFLSDFFFKETLFVPGEPGKFDFLCDKKDILRNARNSEQVRVFSERMSVFLDKDHPAFLPGNKYFRERLTEGVTICVTAFENRYPALQYRLDELKKQMGYEHRISLRGYISSPEVGTSSHYDSRAVTTLQLSGEKEWWYGIKPLVEKPKIGSTKSTILPPIGTLENRIMRPGDVLALPPGAVHKTIAHSESWSVNLAFEYLR